MKKIYLFLSTVICLAITTNLHSQNIKARVISDNGLRMRDMPSVRGNEITLSPFSPLLNVLKQMNRLYTP